MVETRAQPLCLPVRDRFAAPWAVEEIPAGFRVVDKSGTTLAYVYAPDERSRSSMSTALTRAEGLAIAWAIMRLSDVG